ncbi:MULTISPECIES: threo-3-hydroxy-L-aspartate ammonia-lyase [unclassified Microcoleus]|uniref:threo-3-hydroxy-L-aspartate ammonia-lyase n=1 Tax=unclassified Microcoleus TaxID=2642155 RepID=UPI001DC63E3B|nr:MULTISPECIES: threo-3-hydroxy-L-aspartate ammonia-lyase [unclassified Microcoleus]MCC3504561.1 threo-3-hydroxy-L-aspartate ammonia-lyase [Microcoleus sp. PH2017_19_SFW_U_A]TAE39799.1 MAG: threo-3-hydroxy-L-aspartate ammonia-lyase [Oscillatoriales cyanobacterium]MCC3493996.1 threo-3-hydroxy-L-aspartate ammonia-lyase [Microcoleus sp. PH2017_16_JOR_D_A]MCC3525060.1 threo-3-hydroxy-L-aspartate ammonia-lyase [Microcoleus sp. PH2017_20_SFW_D_A]MCC3537256.1 threo-3-hydroxy-L-aspartate ammonia-lyas
MTANLTDKNALQVCFADVEAAAKRLQGKAFKTPVLTSQTVNKQTHSQVFFKCENFQRTGSFKFRGACNALMQLSEAQKHNGVVTFSSGNHAQAIALAAQLLSIPATVVMPADAPKVKQEATRGYGAEIVLYDRTRNSREDLTAQIAREQHLTIIPPYDDARVIAGQGTAAMELIAEVGELDLLLVCCGGGGLLSGCAIAAKTLSPQCKVIGVEPEQADDAARSFRTKTLQTVSNPDTIADGARTPSLGKLTFPLVLHYVDDMATVSEAQIRNTMFFMWERMKIVVEPTGVLAAAALLSGVVKAENSRVGVIVSGGNVDIREVDRFFS